MGRELEDRTWRSSTGATACFHLSGPALGGGACAALRGVAPVAEKSPRGVSFRGPAANTDAFPSFAHRLACRLLLLACPLQASQASDLLLQVLDFLVLLHRFLVEIIHRGLRELELLILVLHHMPDRPTAAYEMTAMLPRFTGTFHVMRSLPCTDMKYRNCERNYDIISYLSFYVPSFSF